MNKKEFKTLTESKILCLDGATGTGLFAAGMPSGVCPEDWIRKNPEAILSLQRAYVEAGSDIIYAPTFTANRNKLSEYGLEGELAEINREMVRLSKQAAEGRAFVAGDLTMTGVSLAPLGETDFEDLVDMYKEQVKVIIDAGVDLFVIETMMSLQESRAAVFAVRELCDLPVMVTLTYNEDKRTLYGTPPGAAMNVLQHLGVDAVGLNCSTGPAAMKELVEEMYEVATVPIIAKPNAGLPELVDEKSVYRMTPEEFAKEVNILIEAGAAIVGGCCGTTPDHIRALSELIKGKKGKAPSPVKTRVLSSERMNVEIELDAPFTVIGERINPTGKKALQAQLREGKLDMVRSFAREQEEKGARILDINMGMSGIDEKEMMLRSIEEVTFATDLPLCIDTSFPEIMEAALRRYPGRALMNSISAEMPKRDEMLAIAKKYGAMYILLPLSESGLPKNIEEKHDNIDNVLSAAAAAGLAREDAVVDLLVATVGADKDAAKNCFATLLHCKNELGLPTVCGLSNISFGLPQRPFVNTAFLTIAISKGLTMAIANPSQDLLIYTALAADMLLGKDGAPERYLALPEAELGTKTGTKKAGGAVIQKGEHHPIFDCVVTGDREGIEEEVKKALEGGMEAKTILNDHLIAGINEVGRLYDEKRFFLPQLISGAAAMEKAVGILEPLLASSGSEAKETVVIATVEGDIHDIGKNLVALMLKNYGYRVIDLGKDVSAETIIDRAIEEKADVIGLSALMTTTMMQMKTVVALAKERGCTSKIVIGGACITDDFAKEIGADGYSEDASECVKLVKRLLGRG